MKMKRILSAIVAAATAFSVIGSQAVFAAGETYVQGINVNFNNYAAEENITANRSIGNLSISPAGNSFSVKEEAAIEGDKYIQYNIGNNQATNLKIGWFGVPKIFQSPVYIEFDYKMLNMTRSLFFKTYFDNYQWGYQFFTLSPDGKVTLGSKTAAIPRKSDLWYHIGIGILGDTAVCYVDGEKVIETGWTVGNLGYKSGNKEGGQYFDIWTGSADTGSEALCLDNFKIYQSANGFSDDFAGNAAYIKSVADGIGFDKTNMKLELTDDMLDAASIINAVTLADGATAACDMENGTLTVTSQNKKISRAYTFSVPDLTSRVYTINTDRETISTLCKRTSVADFLADIKVNSGSIKLMKGNAEVTDGDVTGDMILRYFPDETDDTDYIDYTLVFDNGIVDVNFDGLTITDDPNTGYGTGLGSGYSWNGGIYHANDKLSIVNDAEKGSDVLKYNNATDTISFAISSGFNYTAYNLEFSFKALDGNAKINMASKPNNNTSAFGPGLLVQNGGDICYEDRGAGEERAKAEINKWHNVVYSVSAATNADGKQSCSVYLDGKKVGTFYTDKGKEEYIGYERFEIGPTDTTKATSMLIDDVKIYPVTKITTDEYFDDRYISLSAAEGTNILTVSGDEIALTSDNTPVGEVDGAIVKNENVADMVFINSDGSVVDEGEFNVSAGMKLVIRNMTGETVKVYNFTAASEPTLAVYDANNARLTGKFTAGTLYARASNAALSDECLLVLASYTGTELADCRVVTVSQETNSAAELTVGDDATAVKAFLITKGTLAPAAGAVSLSK